MQTLQANATGPQVILLQKLLSGINGQTFTSGKLDPQTLHAVNEFQRNNGLVADGIVGENTWKRLLAKSYSLKKETDSEEMYGYNTPDLMDADTSTH